MKRNNPTAFYVPWGCSESEIRGKHPFASGIFSPYRIDSYMRKRCKIGDKHNRLLIVKRLGQNKWGQSQWLCHCDCGKETIALTKDLNSGKKRSCGCLRKELISERKWKGHGDISGDYWRTVQHNASVRDVAFNLNIEDAWNMFIKQTKTCALSGLEIAFSRNIKSGEQTASLDRIDSNKGYTIDNIQWVHKKVNLCKNILHNDEFVSLCRMVVERQSIRSDQTPLGLASQDRH